MIRPLRWEARFESGHRTLDFKHQVLFALVNEVHCAAFDGDPALTPRNMLAGFASYARTHFVEEEALMEAFGYPGLAEHRAEHAALCVDIARMASPDSGVEVIDVCAFAYDWLVQHILGADLPMIEHLRGASAA